MFILGAFKLNRHYCLIYLQICGGHINPPLVLTFQKKSLTIYILLSIIPDNTKKKNPYYSKPHKKSLITSQTQPTSSCIPCTICNRRKTTIKIHSLLFPSFILLLLSTFPPFTSFQNNLLFQIFIHLSSKLFTYFLFALIYAPFNLSLPCEHELAEVREGGGAAT